MFPAFDRYAIAMAMRDNQKVVYTSPLKVSLIDVELVPVLLRNKPVTERQFMLYVPELACHLRACFRRHSPDYPELHADAAL